MIIIPTITEEGITEVLIDQTRWTTDPAIPVDQLEALVRLIQASWGTEVFWTGLKILRERNHK